MNIEPLSDYVLIKPLEVESKTESGLYLPDTAKEKPQMGEIMAIGPGKTSKQTGKPMPMIVKKGQKVLYKKWGGNEVKMGTEEWLLLEQGDVMAVVK